MSAPHPTDLSTATPVEIDRALADLSARYQQVRGYAESTRTAIRRERARQSRPETSTRYVEELQGTLAAYQDQAADLAAQMIPYDAEYEARGRWHRYFLVTNTNGHVHRNQTCSTCYPSTQYVWLIDLADCDEDAMIEDWGMRACTHCFPNAATDPRYTAPGRIDRAEAEARAQEKAVEAAEKAAYVITNPDGTPVRTRRSGIIRTERAAEIEYVDTSAYARQLRRSSATHPHHAGLAQECETDAELLLAALAAKRNVDPADLARRLAVKVEKKYLRDYNY